MEEGRRRPVAVEIGARVHDGEPRACLPVALPSLAEPESGTIACAAVGRVQQFVPFANVETIRRASDRKRRSKRTVDEKSNCGKEPNSVTSLIIGEAPFSLWRHTYDLSRPLHRVYTLHVQIPSRRVRRFLQPPPFSLEGLSFLPPLPSPHPLSSPSSFALALSYFKPRVLPALYPAGASDFKNVTVRVLTVGRLDGSGASSEEQGTVTVEQRR